MSAADQPHYVYRVFGEDHSLVYVGATCNLARRLRAHRARGTLRGLYAYHEAVRYPDREAALAAEAAAIATERPLLNVNLKPVDQTEAAYVRIAIASQRASKRELARALGVSTHTFSRKLHGRTRFRPDELEGIARFLRVPVERMGEPERIFPWQVSA